VELVDITRVARYTRVRLMDEPHIHSEVEVNFVTEGRMTYLFAGEAITLRQGQLGLFWGTVPHRVVAIDEPTSFVCLYLSIANLIALPECEALKNAVLKGHLLVARRVDELDPPLFRRWHEDLEARDPRRADLVREELMARLRRLDVEGWSDLSARATPEPVPPQARGMAKAQRMARFIAENLSRRLTVEQIAAAVGLHPSYAMALFKESLGLTINGYITQHRLSHAQAMLLSTDAEIVRIAFESGFGSVSRFYDAFKARFGTSPRRFRERHRGGAAETARA
jgi:AraC-like DNA-binding protein